jgi:hypothetical protein
MSAAAAPDAADDAGAGAGVTPPTASVAPPLGTELTTSGGTGVSGALT